MIAASLDGTQVAAARDGMLVLYSVEPFAAVAAMPLPFAQPELAFVDRQLFLRAGAKLALVATAPRLAVVDRLELPGLVRVLAVSGTYVLLDRDHHLVVATCSSTALTVAPLRAQVTAQHAVGIDRARFLIWSDAVADMWNAATRQPLARVQIELPPHTRAVGTTAQQHSIWLATATTSELVVSRVSDGRTLAIELPAAPLEITSHPMSAWVVADLAGERHAINTALRSCTRVALPSGPRVLVPAHADAFVIVDEGDRLTRHAFTADSVPASVPHDPLPPSDAPPEREPEPAPAPAPAPTAPPPARPPWSRAAAPPAVTSAQTQPVPPDEPPPQRASFGRPPWSRMAPVPAQQQTAPRPAADWRDVLWRWSRRVLDGAPDDPLPSDGSPLEQLCEREGLAAPARRVLALVYAEWLAGKGDTGVAAATLAEIAGPGGWPEALATGRLGELGWVTSDLGRTVLARAVGAFLDGRSDKV